MSDRILIVGYHLEPYERRLLAAMLSEVPFSFHHIPAHREPIPARGVRGHEASIVFVEDGLPVPDDVWLAAPKLMPPSPEQLADIVKCHEYPELLPEFSVPSCPPNQWGQRRHKQFGGRRGGR